MTISSQLRVCLLGYSCPQITDAATSVYQPFFADDDRRWLMIGRRQPGRLCDVVSGCL